MRNFVHNIFKQDGNILKFIIAGIWNTIFGILLYTVMILLYGEKYYLILNIVCNVIAISQSYLCYKFFVFKTKGNYLKEYLKMYAAYGLTSCIGFILLYVFVSIFKISAVYANIIVTFLVMILCYLCHKFYTFRTND